jgi:hypothetical protein
MMGDAFVPIILDLLENPSIFGGLIEGVSYMGT